MYSLLDSPYQISNNCGFIIYHSENTKMQGFNPYWIRHIEYLKNNSRFTMYQSENPKIQGFNQVKENKIFSCQIESTIRICQKRITTLVHGTKYVKTNEGFGIYHSKNP